MKEYVKKLNLTKSSLKKIYDVIYGNCTESVQAMIKTDADYETKILKCQWLLNKVKTIVSGLDTKSKKRVPLHGALFNFLTMHQYQTEINDAYLTSSKSNVKALKLAGGEHVLVSNKLINKLATNITNTDRQKEKEHFLAVAFILRSD